MKAKVEEGDRLATHGQVPSSLQRYGGQHDSRRGRRRVPGRLLERVGGFIEQQEDLKGKTLGALAYPMFFSGVGIIVVTILMVFFVPKFEPMFARMRDKGSLPVATDLLLNMSSFLRSYWWIAATILVAGIVGIQQYIKTPAGHRRFDLVKIKLPLLGSVFLNLAVARFCRVLGTLLVNGVPLLRSLEISKSATAMLSYRKPSPVPVKKSRLASI